MGMPVCVWPARTDRRREKTPAARACPFSPLLTSILAIRLVPLSLYPLHAGLVQLSAIGRRCHPLLATAAPPALALAQGRKGRPARPVAAERRRRPHASLQGMVWVSLFLCRVTRSSAGVGHGKAIASCWAWELARLPRGDREGCAGSSPSSTSSSRRRPTTLLGSRWHSFRSIELPLRQRRPAGRSSSGRDL